MSSFMQKKQDIRASNKNDAVYNICQDNVIFKYLIWFNFLSPPFSARTSAYIPDVNTQQMYDCKV